MKLPRFYHDLSKYCKAGRVLVIFGPRQIGKTTLLNDFLHQSPWKYRLDSGDNLHVRHTLGSEDFDSLARYAEGYELIAIDEAQRVPRVGQGLKILVDQIKGLRVIATGSSSFELAGQVGEPLTGRKRTLTLYPMAQLELRALYNAHELRQRLEEWLIYGGYPEVVATPRLAEKAVLLTELAEAYLLKDILELERVKSSKTLVDLLRLLAFQIGNEVSLTELATQVRMDVKTVARYLDLLEKAFVIRELRGFSRNLRTEITKKSKYYFIDNGIRNAVIANFNGLNLRNDAGVLWENFIFMERLKKRAYKEIHGACYFWRTWEQKEVDLVEERGGRLHGYECKWHARGAKKPRQWAEAYPDASYTLITPENYIEFVT
jgi:predicted AAA+ superfamily ATPase